MPIIVIPVVALLLVLGVVALIPVTLFLRYRSGTVRRLARGWVATINLLMITLSTGLFLVVATVTNTWVPGALIHAVAGLSGGCLLGFLGLALSRWEATARGLYYTPNRWLVLGITLVVSARLASGVWRGWHSWNAGLNGASWLSASGAAGSLAAGAIVLGYYLTYWAGVKRQLKAQVKS